MWLLSSWLAGCTEKLLSFQLQDSQTKKASSLIDSLDDIALDMANSSQSNSTEMDNVGKWIDQFAVVPLIAIFRPLVYKSRKRRLTKDTQITPRPPAFFPAFLFRRSLQSLDLTQAGSTNRPKLPCILSTHATNCMFITLYPLYIVMSVKSLENVRTKKALTISQQDEEEEAPINAVSFPASVLRGDSSTGKNYYTLTPYFLSLWDVLTIC